MTPTTRSTRPARSAPGTPATSGSTPWSSGRQRRSRETAERIVAAALDLLGTRTIDQLSVQEIAARAGVSVGGFYARFPSKEALFEFLNHDVLERLVDHARDLFSPEGTAGLGARDVVHRYIDMAVRGFRDHRRVLQQVSMRSRTSQDATFRERVLALNTELHQLFRERLRERVREIGHPEPAVAMDLALTAASGAMREYVLFGDLRPQFDAIEDERLIAELTEMCCAYMRLEP